MKILEKLEHRDSTTTANLNSDVGSWKSLTIIETFQKPPEIRNLCDNWVSAPFSLTDISVSEKVFVQKLKKI